MDFTPSRRTQQTVTPASRPQYEKLTPIKRRKRLFSLKTVLVIGVMVLIFGGAYMLTHQQKSLPGTQTSNDTQAQDTGKVTQGNPTFPALTPTDKEVTWTHLTPPNSADFYAFSDKLEGVSIRVSEQPLPDKFIDNPSDSLAQLARDYNANRYISINGTTVYIGTSTRGQQSLLFTTDSLLILITADATLNDKQWTDYITSFE